MYDVGSAVLFRCLVVPLLVKMRRFWWSSVEYWSARLSHNAVASARTNRLLRLPEWFVSATISSSHYFLLFRCCFSLHLKVVCTGLVLNYSGSTVSWCSLVVFWLRRSLCDHQVSGSSLTHCTVKYSAGQAAYKHAVSPSSILWHWRKLGGKQAHHVTLASCHSAGVWPRADEFGDQRRPT